MPDTIDQLTILGQAVSGSAYARWLQEPVFTAFRPPAGGPDAALELTRADFIRMQFGQHLNAVARLSAALSKRRINNLAKLQEVPAADLLALKGVGERQVLAACVVMEAFGVEEQDIMDWIDKLHPHRSRAGAIEEATRKGKKRRHE